MKKIKIGFSMLVAILVLSIVTGAMAAKPAATAGIGVKAFDADSVIVSPGAQGPTYSKGSIAGAETSWQVTLYNAADDSVAGTMQEVTTNSVQFDGVVEGNFYYAIVVAKNADGSASAYTSEDFKFHFSSTYNGNNVQYLGLTEIKDNDIPNANGTGVGGMAKGISGHRTHGDYKNNTNSCASCHQTHTAAGRNLLFKETAEEACLACHDGTGMTIYNVFPTSMANDNGAGTFAGTTAGNMSVHLTNESVELSAAPGSNLTISGANWSGEFSCDTCHNPHGSYSSRLLQTNTAGFMNVPRTYKYDGTTLKQWYGGLFANVPVVDATADTFTVNATDKSLLDTNGSLGAAKLDVNQELKLMKYKVTAADVAVGGYYEKTGLAQNDIIWQFVRMQSGGTKWQRIPFNTNSNRNPDFTASPTPTYTSVNNVKGYVKISSADITSVTNFRALLIVKLPQVATAALPVNGVQETKTPWNSASSPVATATTVAYAEYCGTCHVDYASASGYATTADNGEKAYHHTANSSQSGRSCAYCHYAHGTDVTFMRDAVGNTVESLQTSGDLSLGTAAVPMNATDAKAYLLDKNPSSALKRYTNMSVCYGCHVSSHYAGLGNNGSTGLGSSTGLSGTGLPTGIWQ